MSENSREGGIFLTQTVHQAHCKRDSIQSPNGLNCHPQRKTTTMSSPLHCDHQQTGGDPLDDQEPPGWEQLMRMFSPRNSGPTQHRERQVWKNSPRSVALDYPPSGSEPFRLLLVSGTIYPSTSLLHLCRLSSSLASRLISSPFPIPVPYLIKCLCSDTCHFGHFNRLCYLYLLTYLFTYRDIWQQVVSMAMFY